MDFLHVQGTQIVDESGRAWRLRGTSVGGWMNMEDFITGHSGSEHTLRLTLAGVLGPRRAKFFFERFLTHFLHRPM